MPLRYMWDGNEWEAHCRNLLSIKFGADIQFVPARVGGDGGLDAFRLDDGIIYQCYAAQDVFTNQALTAAQKRKISDDTGTLCEKIEQTQEILGEAYRVRRWVLLTPEFDDKEVLRHARNVEKKVRLTGPPWLADDFHIQVITDGQMFPDILGRLGLPGLVHIDLAVDAPGPDKIREHVDPSLIEKLTAKLCVNAMLLANPEELNGYATETLMSFVYGKRQLDALEDRYGATYMKVQKRVRTTFASLTRAMAATDGGPAGVESIARDLAAGLAADLPALPRDTCESLARHFIADWFMNCPLRFRAVS